MLLEIRNAVIGEITNMCPVLRKHDTSHIMLLEEHLNDTAECGYTGI